MYFKRTSLTKYTAANVCTYVTYKTVHFSCTHPHNFLLFNLYSLQPKCPKTTSISTFRILLFVLIVTCDPTNIIKSHSYWASIQLLRYYHGQYNRWCRYIACMWQCNPLAFRHNEQLWMNEERQSGHLAMLDLYGEQTSCLWEDGLCHLYRAGVNLGISAYMYLYVCMCACMCM